MRVALAGLAGNAVLVGALGLRAAVGAGGDAQDPRELVAQGPSEWRAVVPMLAAGEGGSAGEPAEPPGFEADAVAAAVARTRAGGGQLTAGELLELLAWTGWPVELWDEVAAIAWCESRWSPGAVGDGGRSVGLLQLWTGWFEEGEEWHDAAVNLRVGLRVYRARGRFGGGGGWSCADRLGIP
ncbi:MAG: hypothetical protein KatS3mg064_0613 [Tepidiforma sp.]|nr:hypothetical protein [Tepidiforma sp.]GIW17456.1 MAG: hypothetical protein KatS3mg064_0613 [Tepidiforma sp.]